MQTAFATRFPDNADLLHRGDTTYYNFFTAACCDDHERAALLFGDIIAYDCRYLHDNGSSVELLMADIILCTALDCASVENPEQMVEDNLMRYVPRLVPLVRAE